jgi:hypothetical protein
MDGTVWINWVNSYVHTIILLANNGYSTQLQAMTGNALIQYARAMLAQMFYDETDCCDLLFVDSDISWDPEGALRLIQSPHDVIAGVYPAKVEGTPIFQTRGVRNGYTSLIETDGVPGGFLKISRRAIKKMRAAYPELKAIYREKEVHMLFDPMIVDTLPLGEDYAFCERWIRLGGKVFVDPDINFEHHGRKVFTGNMLKDQLIH